MFNFYIKGRVVEFKASNNSVFVELKQVDEFLEKEYLAYWFPNDLNDKKHFFVDNYEIELSHDLFGVVKDGQEYIFEFEYDDSNNEKDKIDSLENVKELLNKISALLKNNNKCISVISCGYQDGRI